MRHVTIYTTDEEFVHFIELASNLKYVTKIERDDEEPSKEAVLNNIKDGFEEMRLFKEGKKKGQSLKDFLDEL